VHGEVSAREVLEDFLQRIEQRNGELNAIVALDSDAARACAAALDGLPPAERGPLHGLPVAIKDTAAAAGLSHTEGFLAHRDRVATTDDLHVARMRAAGAVIVGKTNIPELAAGARSTNQVYGCTVNPWDPGRSAGGSSGGAACAVGAGLIAVADGSDMGGSLRIPAALCGVVGLRPTPGLIPAVEASDMFDPLTTTGPIARTVDDLAMLLGVMAGPSTMDPRSIGWGDRITSLATGLLPRVPLQGLRVAVAEDLGGRVTVDPQVRRTVHRVANLLAEQGALVQEACPRIDTARSTFMTLRASQFHSAYADQLAEHPEWFNGFLSENIAAGESLSAAQVQRALSELTSLTRGAVRFFEDFDLLLAPTTQRTAFRCEEDWPHEVAGRPMAHYLDWVESAWSFTPLGSPALSLPAGFDDDGLPIGVQLLGMARSDRRLLGIAASLEEALGPLPAPTSGM